ncbi:hypothetical protein GGTG_06531 [Gaeumannomyces tritici R3-111a-1]|uniref:Uncharacterized protein n=1 Tax=Gaeumannomyces tritici (strain R3-111a-1) TaxID=644352 RepID=J3NZ31_GAET3|nr:hypothetical protein GGTG_06531 [Gaeumannomyces tritici R3-111a-1]EJT76614.1 hypothetical protein GGTG_06531 [Gaeumannomyces tritici R3-111a-1]
MLTPSPSSTLTPRPSTAIRTRNSGGGPRAQMCLLAPAAADSCASTSHGFLAGLAGHLLPAHRLCLPACPAARPSPSRASPPLSSAAFRPGSSHVYPPRVAWCVPLCCMHVLFMSAT